MSTINNIPFDINRTPIEKNTAVPTRGTNPVQHSEHIHQTQRHNPIAERRSGHSRRKQTAMIKQNKRLLTERRQKFNAADKTEDVAENIHTTGRIIDLEV